MQRTPAGLPFGIPGIGELIDGAIQHAPQPLPDAETHGNQSETAIRLSDMFNTKENHKSLSAATKEEGDSSPSLREFPALL